MKRRRATKPVQWPVEPPFRIAVAQSAAREARRRAIAHQIRHPFTELSRERWLPVARPVSAVLALTAILAASLAYSHREPPDTQSNGQAPINSAAVGFASPGDNVTTSSSAGASPLAALPAALSSDGERAAASDTSDVATAGSTDTSMRPIRRSDAVPRATTVNTGPLTSGGSDGPTPIGPTISTTSSPFAPTTEQQRAGGLTTTMRPTTQQPPPSSSTTSSTSSSPPTSSVPTSSPPPTTARPEAVSDSARVQADKDTKLPVLANDRAEPGATLNVSSLQIVSQPAHASSFKVHDDHLHYHSVKGYVGGDSITYRICSSSGLCATGQVSIDVVAKL